MAVLKTDDAMWRTGVYCICGDQYYAYVDILTERSVSYNYLCKKCNTKGPWSALARRHLGRKDARNYR